VHVAGIAQRFLYLRGMSGTGLYHPSLRFLFNLAKQVPVAMLQEYRLCASIH
jgi:hypothetical protein